MENIAISTIVGTWSHIKTRLLRLFFVEFLNSWIAVNHEIHENWYPTNKNESTVFSHSPW